MKVKVAQSCPTLCSPMNCIVHGILQDRILEWVVCPFSKGSSQPGGRTQVPVLQADSLPAKPHISVYAVLPNLVTSTTEYPSSFFFFFWWFEWTNKINQTQHRVALSPFPFLLIKCFCVCYEKEKCGWILHFQLVADAESYSWKLVNHWIICITGPVDNSDQGWGSDSFTQAPSS